MKNLFEGQIPFMKPWLGKDEIAAVSGVIRSGWISQGQVVAEFEQTVASYVGAKFGVATNSCTSALHLSLKVKGIGKGDEVLCPSFTCMATANAIEQTGATVKFVDIDETTYNLDPEKTEKAVGRKTKAIMLVHQIGLPAPLAEFKIIAKKYRLVLIQDAATALGSEYKGNKIGEDKGITSFSFHPRKIITTGEGGMIVTDDSDFAKRAKVLRSTGASISDLERHKAKGSLVQKYYTYGYNYRMTDIQGAIGLVQMKKIERILSARRNQAKVYDDAFRQTETIVTPFIPPYATPCYSSYLVRINHSKIKRDELLKEMAKKNISCRIGIQPLHQEPYYRSKFGRSNLPATEKVARDSLFLPIFPLLKPNQQEEIIAVLKKIVS